MKLARSLSYYRWPIYLGGLLAMSVVGQGVLVYVATRPDAPRPIGGYYQRALQWDADEAVVEASRQLGWTVRFTVPADVPHTAGMPRPVDVFVQDRQGTPVLGLTGTLQAARPSEPRLSQAGDLTGIPHLPGTYRTLVRMDQPGLWELRLDARQGAQRFVSSERVVLAADGPGTAAGGG
jgi:nitrogen fixation protein FixH